MDQVTTADARAPAAAARRVRWRITMRSAQMLRAGVAAARVFAREWVRLRRQAPGEAVTRAAGRALVALCTTLGATFIKVGQIASTRADLLPRPLVDELALLRDRVPPFPFVAVRATVEAELGRMIFLHGFVHADLHPGNVRFLAPRRVVLLDLGLVGRLDDVDRIAFAGLLYALSTGDGVSVARIFWESAPHQQVPDYPAYEREIVAFVDNIRARGLANLQVTLEIGRIFDILRRHRIQARSHMTMVNLALMTAEGLGKRLAPELSLTDAALPYLSEALAAAPDSPQPAG